MNLPDHIFDQAIQRLRQGEDVFTVSASYPEFTAELQQLLPVATTAMRIPKLVVPTPHKQFRFAEVKTLPYYIIQTLHVMKIAVVPMSLVIVLLGGFAVVKAAENSLPNSPFYSLKRAGESTRLTLTFNQEKEASLHVAYTQKRLDEVKQAINNNDSEAEAAAIVELNEQSEKTFATVPQVAVASALTNKDQALLNTLVAINKEQKDVLTGISTTDEATTETTTALNTTKENDKTLALLLAAVNEQTLANLPNKYSVTGDIIYLTNTRITVEKTTFIINSETYMAGADGAQLETAKQLNGRVAIVGTQSDQGLIAKQISVLAAEPTATIPPQPTTTVPPKPTPEPTTQPSTPANPTPNEVTGGYIPEPTTPQYTP